MDTELPRGPLVDPFPWTLTTIVERDYTREEFARLAERFTVAERMIAVKDSLRLQTRVGLVTDATNISFYLKQLEHRFDELEFGYTRGVAPAGPDSPH